MAQDRPRTERFLIVGGGASGVLMAIQLLRRNGTRQVILCDRSQTIAAGVAYSTREPGHLLNVPAARMSAFPDDPEHFVRWMSQPQRAARRQYWTPGSFVPRRIYREYLLDLLAPYTPPHDTSRSLLVRHTEIVDLRETEAGIEAIGAGGDLYQADAAILALGNEEPHQAGSPWLRHGWHSDSIAGLPSGASVAIIGTGLTMIDNVISLLDADHTGDIVAVSPRGLLPRPHGVTNPVSHADAAIPYGRSMSEITRWLRRRVALSPENWRGVVDGLRPFTQQLWQSLPIVEKARFLRHARVWWDVHRHRVAPDVHARVEAVRNSGQLSIIAGRVSGMEEERGLANLRIVPFSSSDETTIRTSRIIDCRGLNLDLRRTRNPLLQALLARSAIRPDELGLGVDVRPDGAIVAADGSVSTRLSAIGPTSLGVFWEIIAIPDIRVQVAEVADRLAGASLISELLAPSL